MLSLKENRGLILAAVLIPVFMVYLDETVMKGIREFHLAHQDMSRLLQSADRAMYFAAHGTTMIGGAVILFLFGRYINRRLGDMPLSLLAGLAISGISVQIIKHLIGRARPRVSDSLLIIGPSLRGSYDSFPSGHTTMAFCLAYILSNHYPAFRILFYMFAVCEGLARIDGTSHFPSDVLGGAIWGIIIAKAVLSRISGAAPMLVDES